MKLAHRPIRRALPVVVLAVCFCLGWGWKSDTIRNLLANPVSGAQWATLVQKSGSKLSHLTDSISIDSSSTLRTLSPKSPSRSLDPLDPNSVKENDKARSSGSKKNGNASQGPKGPVPLEVGICSKSLCLTESSCDLCIAETAPEAGPRVTAYFSAPQNADLSSTAEVRDSETGKTIGQAERRAGSNRYAIELKNFQFDTPTHWTIESKNWNAEAKVELSLKHLPLPSCLKERQLRFGICPSVQKFGSFYGKNRIEFDGIAPCLDSDPQGTPIKEVARLTYFQDSCSPSWFQNLDQIIVNEIGVLPDFEWKTELSPDSISPPSPNPSNPKMPITKTGRVFALNSLGKNTDRPDHGFFQALHALLARDRNLIDVQATLHQTEKENREKKPIYSLVALTPADTPDISSIWENALRLWPKYWRRSNDTDSSNEQKRFASFESPSSIAKTEEPEQDSCKSDLDCASLCCSKGQCAPHDPSRGIYCGKAPKESCLGSEFCVSRLRNDMTWVPVKNRHTPDDPYCAISSVKHRTHDHCVDYRCFTQDDQDFPYPIKLVIDPETHETTLETDNQIRAESRNPKNCSWIPAK